MHDKCTISLKHLMKQFKIFVVETLYRFGGVGREGLGWVGVGVERSC